MAQHFRAMAVLSEDPGPVPSTARQFTTTRFHSQGTCCLLLASSGTRHADGAYTHMQAKDSNVKKFKIKRICIPPHGYKTMQVKYIINVLQ